MTRIAIPKVRDDRSPTEYRIKLDPSIHDDLMLYHQLYEKTYGQQIDPKDLLEPIISRFLANDRGFRRFKKEYRRTGSGSNERSASAPRTP